MGQIDVDGGASGVSEGQFNELVREMAEGIMRGNSQAAGVPGEVIAEYDAAHAGLARPALAHEQHLLFLDLFELGMGCRGTHRVANSCRRRGAHGRVEVRHVFPSTHWPSCWREVKWRRDEEGMGAMDEGSGCAGADDGVAAARPTVHCGAGPEHLWGITPGTSGVGS